MADSTYAFAVYPSPNPNRLPHLVVSVNIGGPIDGIKVIAAEGDLARAQRICDEAAAGFEARVAAGQTG